MKGKLFYVFRWTLQDFSLNQAKKFAEKNLTRVYFECNKQELQQFPKNQMQPETTLYTKLSHCLSKDEKFPPCKSLKTKTYSTSKCKGREGKTWEKRSKARLDSRLDLILMPKRCASASDDLEFIGWHCQCIEIGGGNPLRRFRVSPFHCDY